MNSLRSASAVAHRCFSSASVTPGVQVASLDDTRSVIRLSGPTLLEYLQKLISNDAHALCPGGPPLYACVLSPQGRFLHDMFIHPSWEQGADTPAVFVDCDAGQRRSLMDLLQRYSLHHKIDVSSAAKGYTVLTAWGSGIAGAAAAPERQWPTDPRLSALGRRTVLPRGSAPAPTASPADYQLWRIKQGVAEGDTEIPSGETTPLEYNLDVLHAISYSKGCYVGQEFVARVHALGTVRKRVMPFRIGETRGSGCMSGVTLTPGRAHVFEVWDADESLKPIGQVRAVQGGWGLAKLRLKEAMAAIREERPLLVGDLEAGTGYAEIWPQRPAWWPGDWGQESAFEEEPQRKAA